MCAIKLAKIGFILFSISSFSFAHWDGAYFRSADDGFDFGRNNRWMENICDHTLLSEIAIPGAHYSGTQKGYGGDSTTTNLRIFGEK